MAPHYEPLVNSLGELVDKLDYIKPVVRKGFGMDVTISVMLLLSVLLLL